MRLPLALALLAGLGAPAPALAHHGWSGYDSSNLMTLQGTVQSATIEHPHGHLSLRTADKTWEVVLAPPSRMEARGLPKGTIQAGQTVTVQGYAHRDNQTEFRAERIEVGGKTVELR